MANRLVDVTTLYNNEAAYPNLILELHGGRSIKVHRAILNQAGRYFDKICDDVGVIGDRTSVGELHLKYLSSPEAAAAVIALVRIIYGFPLPAANGLTWPVWWNMAMAAQRHLEKIIIDQVVQSFMTLACQQTDSCEVIKIMKELASYNSTDHDEFVETIREHHAVKLLRNKACRKELGEHDRDTLGRLIDHVVDMVEGDSCDDSDSMTS